MRTKVKPYVRYNKETDETIAKAIYEEEVILVEPTTADEYNKEVTERFYKYQENQIMGKVKGSIPRIEYDPVYLPPERELLYAISNLVVALRHKDKPIADLPECIETVDQWLTEQYGYLDKFFKKNVNGNGAVVSGNGQPVCEEDH